jgi:hypothetical protein
MTTKTLPWIVANGLELAPLAGTSSEPKGERRDIGERDQAVDGTLRATQQTRKRDVKFTSVPLIQSDAMAWESYLTGEGHSWSFDTLGLYSSKGLPPTAITAATVVSSGSGYVPKFGGKFLLLGASTGTVSWANATLNTFGSGAPGWTFSVYRFNDEADAGYVNYVFRSDGAKWVNGVRNDAYNFSAWFAVSSGHITLTWNGGADDIAFDDMFLLPFKVLDSWPPLFAARTAAFSPLPYLDVTGGLIAEQATRRVIGSVAETLVATASGTRSRLDVELKAK